MGEVVRTEETAIKLRDGLVAYYKELQAKYEQGSIDETQKGMAILL